MNEIRESMRDQAGEFLTRKEYEGKHEAIVSELKILREYADISKGKASQNALILTALLSLAGFILGLIHLFRGM
jgi:hypothetical protein